MSLDYEIEFAEGLEDADYTPRGGAIELIYNHAPEVILAGPAETGKSIAACWKSHTLACKYPGAQGALVRKTNVSIAGTIFLTMKRVIAGAPVTVYGGDNQPEKLIYSNGSVIWIGGMDNPTKVLSAERDFIQVCQAEELSKDDWEIMTSRVTGRGAIIPFPQIFGDANPGPSKHWIIERKKAGSLELLRSIHRDNPMLYNADGSLTEQGKKTISRLSAMTGVRRKRLFEGLWASADGAVFDNFDPLEGGPHVRKQNIENYSQFRLAMDEGYTNPAVILVIAEDNDGRRHIFEEFYETGKLEKQVVAAAVVLAEKYHTKNVACDNAAAGLIAALRDAGLQVKGGKGRVLDRINAIRDDLEVLEDRRPRLTIDPSCINTINDFESYEWNQGKDGSKKDEPKKQNDHSPDAVGYDYDVEEDTGGGFGVGYKKR